MKAIGLEAEAVDNSIANDCFLFVIVIVIVIVIVNVIVLLLLLLFFNLF